LLRRALAAYGQDMVPEEAAARRVDVQPVVEWLVGGAGWTTIDDVPKQLGPELVRAGVRVARMSKTLLRQNRTA
jgi:hypothetical protein